MALTCSLVKLIRATRKEWKYYFIEVILNISLRSWISSKTGISLWYWKYNFQKLKLFSTIVLTDSQESSSP